ncbi:hypothetical protein [Bacillus sp. JCM 19034]|uniref:hypothetical protein n=1 Tax=Bacillus sp. JCM 19034 TaxID=1481928 RepID=UPI000A8469E9
MIDRAFSRIYDTFAEVQAPANVLIETMGHAFVEIIQTHREEILMVMQSYSIAEPEIRDHVRKLYQTIFESITIKFESAGIPNAKANAAHFIGTGLLITVAEVLDLPQLFKECDHY